MAFPSVWLALFTGVTVAACIGDVWIFAKLHPFPGDALVIEHPSEIGCDIFEDANPAPRHNAEDQSLSY